MPSKDFTSKQKEIVARKLGYDGPMSMFDEFLKSDPGIANKYGLVLDKYMAKGGAVVKKLSAGSLVTDPNQQTQGQAENTQKQLDWILLNKQAGQPSKLNRQVVAQPPVDKGQGTTGTINTLPATPPEGTFKTLPATPPAGGTFNTKAISNPATRYDEERSKIRDQINSFQNQLPEYVELRKLDEEIRKSGDRPTAAQMQQMQLLSQKVQSALENTPMYKEEQRLSAQGQQQSSTQGQQQSSTQGQQQSSTGKFSATAQAYFDKNPDVLDAYKANTYGLTPDEFVRTHYEKYGSKENRLSPAEAAQPTTASKVKTDPVTGKPIIIGQASYTPSKIEETTGQIVSAGGAATNVTKATATTATAADKVSEPKATDAKTIDASKTAEGVKTALTDVSGKTGTVSDKAQITAEKGTLSEGAKATAATFDEENKRLISEDATRSVDTKELVSAETADTAPTVTAHQATIDKQVEASTRKITSEEIAVPAAIQEANMAQAQAIKEDKLVPDAIAVAAKLDKFKIEDGTLAEFIKGEVTAQSTVQYQLSELMKSFDDGKTPTWAAGAIRAANAAMAARGLGGSSIAGAAIFQAAMESALPIAQQDAKTFETMNLQNLNNRQQVALSNAAAQQNVKLANFNAEQQAALQNSANAFSLQSQNLSNTQQTMIANAQIKAALQGQNLSNQQQSIIANAARQAEVNNINLNNQQQTAITNSANNLEVELANLSAKQQAALANAQLQSGLELKVLDNKQQTAVINAAKYSEANNMQFTAQQNAVLHNSTLMQSIGLANLNSEQATVLQNAATYASMDMANLNNRQQAAVENAKSFLQMDLTNLSNEQQMAVFKAQSTIQSLFNDAAAENATKQFNATSQMQTDQYFAGLKTQVNQFNAAQTNAMNQFNAGQTNAVSQFNSQLQSNREQFNAQQRLVVDQSNAEWRRNIATANTAAINTANQFAAQANLSLTTTEYNNTWQTYRDGMQYAYQSGQNDLDRENRLAIARLQENATIKAAEAARTAAAVSALGGLTATVLGKTTLGQTLVDAAGNLIKGVTGPGGNVEASVADIAQANLDLSGSGVLNIGNPVISDSAENYYIPPGD